MVKWELQAGEPHAGAAREGGSAMTRLGVAVIGAGRMGERYTQVLTGLPNAQVVAVCDMVHETAVRVAAAAGVPAYTDFRQMLEEEGNPGGVRVPRPGAPRSVRLRASAASTSWLKKPLAVEVADGEAIIAARARRRQADGRAHSAFRSALRQRLAGGARGPRRRTDPPLRPPQQHPLHRRAPGRAHLGLLLPGHSRH